MSVASDHAVPNPAPLTVPRCFAFLGNPNTGKSTLFGRLCGIRTKTANFPGSTVEAKIGRMQVAAHACDVVDLPGIYGLNLDRPESRIAREFMSGTISLGNRPDAAVIVVDATNLERNLILVSQVLQQGIATIVVLNMMDLARRSGLHVDTRELGRRIGCPVVPVCARSGEGVHDLRAMMAHPVESAADLPDPTNAAAAADWANATVMACVVRRTGDRPNAKLHDRLDAAFTHPLLGLVIFTAIMTGLFYTIFALATVPMDLIELAFFHLGRLVGGLVPAGPVHDLLVDGIVAGVAGTVVFLPQICLLFFLISILEDTGYLARAAFVMDRVLRHFGLPGQAFVPLLSAHACAIPALMATRLIPDQRQRIATVLVAPFLSCSARLPVYVLLVGILFPGRPLLAGVAFTGCYLLGAVAALLTALLARRTILRGPSGGLVLELPSYKLPSLRTALLTTFDRAWMFLRKAGTVIVAICIVLWWLSAYPTAAPSPAAVALQQEAAQVAAQDPIRSADLEARAAVIASRHAMSESFVGRIGKTVQPVFEPLGLDWQLTVGVLTSFAAREVFVSTLAVLFAGADDAQEQAVLERITTATRDDGSPVFTPRTAASLLVFYVLAMQCLPTLPVTARESGRWGWALLQLAYMSGLAYALAWLVHTALGWAGVP